jgi:hypothetical protein
MLSNPLVGWLLASDGLFVLFLNHTFAYAYAYALFDKFENATNLFLFEIKYNCELSPRELVREVIRQDVNEPVLMMLIHTNSGNCCLIRNQK